jgi:16S rRNA (adenine(1408)-N(1))-methyltransferase
LQQLLAPYQGRIAIDIGTGDGLFVYNSARRNSNKFFIGIDANRRPLEKISEKIHRKPSKGGLSNVLFAQSAVEMLPSELDHIASEIHVNFPWGSLLRTVLVANEAELRNIRRLAHADAMLQVVVGIDVERDQSELALLGLSAADLEYFRLALPTKYLKAGFEVVGIESLSGSSSADVQTSWAKRLRASHNRSFIRIVATAIAM